MSRDSKLLKEIRDDYDYCVSYWRDIRAEGSTDMRFVSGDPWPAKERRAREAANRPCIALDELNQYINQVVNDVRQNKRSVKVVPRTGGATDATAELRANLIRDIEYDSNAQAAYITAFEGQVQRSYGFARISKRWKGFVQELVIKRIPNPDSVYIDPDCKEADCSDMKRAFIIERMRVADFKRKWPNAEITDFTADVVEVAPMWVTQESVQVAEAWRVESKPGTLLQLDDGSQDGMEIQLSELPDGSKLSGNVCTLPGGVRLRVLQQRSEPDISIVQYITNGVEILEKNAWDSKKYIPIGVCLGKELFVDEGAGSVRKLLSLIRLARDPQLLYCYYRTCEMELAGMVPKTPAIGYEGQFEGQEDQWAAANRVPTPYLQAKATLDATGSAVLPLPQWNRWEPPIQALEMGAEAARRAIQAALGMYNTSVGKRDTAGQSGVAVKALDAQSSQGSFHFIDSYDNFLKHMGRMLDDLLLRTYDTSRDVGTRKPNDEHEVVRINDPNHVDPKTNQPQHNILGDGEHGVSITVGPSSDSQRDDASDFMDKLASNEQIFPRIADLVVKMRQLGPIGDEIAKRLTPPDIAAQQNGQQAPSPEVKAMSDQHQQLVQAVHKLQDALDSKQAELELKKYTVDEQEKTKRTLGLAAIDSAEGIKQLQEELQIVHNKLDRMHESDMAAQTQAHAADMQQGQQAHEQTQATQAQSAAADQQTQAQQAAAEQAAQTPEAA